MTSNQNDGHDAVVGQSVCPACGLEAGAMGVLDNGDRVYLHGSGYCRHDLDDESGRLMPAVDQIRSHKEAVRDE